MIWSDFFLSTRNHVVGKLGPYLSLRWNRKSKQKFYTFHYSLTFFTSNVYVWSKTIVVSYNNWYYRTGGNELKILNCKKLETWSLFIQYSAFLTILFASLKPLKTEKMLISESVLLSLGLLEHVFSKYLRVTTLFEQWFAQLTEHR